jgi:deferrochelatase/peroxidase EfeB
MANRHRIIRRGLPYGPRLPEGQRDDGVDRGVIFIAMNADLERQFEFVQQQWLNYGNAFGLGNDKDPLTGNHGNTGKFLVQGDSTQPDGRPPHICTGLRRFVTTRGGDYFFVPSISAVRMIARDEVSAR